MKVSYYEAAENLRDSGDIWELVAIIFEMVMSYLASNFYKDNKFQAPAKIDVVFMYNSGRLVFKIIRCVRIYTTDYEKFKTTYLNLPISELLKKL